MSRHYFGEPLKDLALRVVRVSDQLLRPFDSLWSEGIAGSLLDRDTMNFVAAVAVGVGVRCVHIRHRVSAEEAKRLQVTENQVHDNKSASAGQNLSYSVPRNTPWPNRVAGGAFHSVCVS